VEENSIAIEVQFIRGEKLSVSTAKLTTNYEKATSFKLQTHHQRYGSVNIIFTRHLLVMAFTCKASSVVYDMLPPCHLLSHCGKLQVLPFNPVCLED
jgi:hypothetical protein